MSKWKSIIASVLVGAFLTGCISVGMWIIIYFASGKLYTGPDVERKFRMNALGSVALCNKKNPVDKWIFHKMNGLYSQFSKEEQEKIVLLNIKNELKKNKEIEKVMLISSLGNAISESAQFIKTALERDGFIVSEVVNIIGRTDNLEMAENFDTAIVVENLNQSKINLTEAECSTIKEYIPSVSGIVLV